MGVIGEPKCIEWSQWFDDARDPCIQYRKCEKFEEDNNLFLKAESSDTKLVTDGGSMIGFFLGGMLGLLWIAYRP